MNPGVSVIICCFNSVSRLPETLKHLSLQHVLDDLNWEIIIVDNCSTDQTVKVANQLWNDLNVPNIRFTVLEEWTPGKSHALKKGTIKALFDYILVCDDDNWLSPDYINQAFQKMEHDQTIGVLGGCGIFNPEVPCWPEIELHQIAYVNGLQTWAESDHWVYGAGSVFRKHIIINLFEKGWNYLASGSNALFLVEDVELCYAVYLSGYRITSDNTLYFSHFVPFSKQNIRYILSLVYRQSYSFVLLCGYRKLIERDNNSIQQILNHTLKNNIKALLFTFGKHCYSRLSGKGTPTFQQQVAMQSYKGAVMSVIRNKNKIAIHFNQLSRMQKDNDQLLKNGSFTD